LVMGLLYCLAGYRVLKILALLTGFFGALVGGIAVGNLLGLSGEVSLGIGAAVGLILGILAFRIRLLGVFILCWSQMALAMFWIVNSSSLIWVAVCAGVGLVAAVLSLKWEESLVIFTTALHGALLIGVSLVELIGLRPYFIVYIIAGVCTILGMSVQTMAEGKRRGKQAVARAEDIKAEESVEVEVEAARAILSESVDLEEVERKKSGLDNAGLEEVEKKKSSLDNAGLEEVESKNTELGNAELEDAKE